MLENLNEAINGLQLNGHPEQRLPHNLNVFVPGIESRSLVLELQGLVALSTGSACSTAEVEPSHVIKALGFGVQRAHGSVRYGLGRFTTAEEVRTVIGSTISVVTGWAADFTET